MATNEDLIVKLEQVLAELEADKKKAKDKELAEAWTKTAAVSIVILAVLGATAVQRQGSFGSRSLKHLNAAIYRQVEASDQWAFYQAKSTKANLYEAGGEQVRALAAGPEQAKALAEIEGRAHRYRQEQDAVKAEAQRFEALRDGENQAAEANATAGGKLSLAALSFQVSVALASIAVVIKRQLLWYTALALGVVGTAQLLHTLGWLSPVQ
jgi:hypothetical protein